MKTVVNSFNCIEGNSAVAIGKFDGLHIGHDVILSRLSDCKKRGLTTVLLTFDPSPDVFFYRANDEELLSRTEMEERLSQYDIDVHLILSFTKELAMMPPEEFVDEILVNLLHVKEIVAGEDVSFGYKGRGNAEFLKQIEKTKKIQSTICKKLCVGGIEVSSSQIRQLIAKGEIEKANELLGYKYSFTGVIEEGKHLGRTYGFPTVNFYPEKKKILPPRGVYFTITEVRDRKFYSMTNIGLRPSVEGKSGINLESHLFGDAEEYYTESCRVNLYHYHRAEHKFESLDLLIEQLKSDREYCKQYFGL